MTSSPATYTPVYDAVLALQMAMLHGYVMRMQSLGRGVCCASLSTMAEAMGASARDTRRRLRELEQLGLITRSERAGHASEYRAALPDHASITPAPIGAPVPIAPPPIDPPCPLTPVPIGAGVSGGGVNHMRWREDRTAFFKCSRASTCACNRARTPRHPRGGTAPCFAGCARA